MKKENKVKEVVDLQPPIIDGIPFQGSYSDLVQLSIFLKRFKQEIPQSYWNHVVIVYDELYFSGSGSFETEVFYYRNETPEEEECRLKSEAENKLKSEEEERKEYERLKEKFG